MASAIDAVYMVEASAELRTAQKNLLCGQDQAMTESKLGWQSTSKHGNLPIHWTDTIKAVPAGDNKTPFIVAHEFFDALPIHAFQVVPVREPVKSSPKSATGSSSPPPTPAGTPAEEPPMRTTPQWREMVVAPTPANSTHASLNTPKSEQHGGPPPDFQMTLAPFQTRHSTYLPESSPRYHASIYASDFASRIGGSPTQPKPTASGAALILDYGTSATIPVNSLRGIKHHKRVSPFSEPGLVDLSADVDFMALAEAAMQASEGVEIHGPVDQADFLGSMGILQRAEMLAKQAEQKKKGDGEEILRACRRLVDRGPGGMGKLYKALAILPENEGRRRPVGFGGDVM
jgi:NADH dehydrogenase [ubiquinone] 1 alpha subcomplex assembly factor 7